MASGANNSAVPEAISAKAKPANPKTSGASLCPSWLSLLISVITVRVDKYKPFSFHMDAFIEPAGDRELLLTPSREGDFRLPKPPGR